MNKSNTKEKPKRLIIVGLNIFKIIALKKQGYILRRSGSGKICMVKR